MDFKKFGFLFACIAVAALLVPQLAYAQSEGMTFKEYEAQIATYQQRTAASNKALAECRAAGDALSKQIADIDGQIAAARQELYDLLGTDQAGIDAYLAELGRIETRLMGMLNLSDTALFDVRDEFDGITERVKELKKSKISYFPASQTKLKNIDQLIQRITDRMPAKRIKNYTVRKNDSLWKIARNPDMYGNPYLWPRIYVENRGLIKHPDVIYPNWVLKVPFGVDRGQHLVLQGHTLSSIASQVYKDPSKWSRIYQANKSQILDPNLVFPAQVLDVPN